MPSPCELHAWGRGFVDATNNRRCALGDTASIAYGEWATNLYQQGAVLLEETMTTGATNSAFTKGTLVVHSVYTQEIAVTASWKGFSWDFFPMPVGPVQQTALVSTNFYAVNASTKYPVLSWELVRWLTVEPTFSRFLMTALLYPPARLDQWEEWKSIVESVAPSLSPLNLNVFVDQAAANHLWAGRVFPYSDTEALPILNTASPEILSGAVSVSEGYKAIATQIDALANA